MGWRRREAVRNGTRREGKLQGKDGKDTRMDENMNVALYASSV